MNIPHTIQRTSDYHLAVEERPYGWMCTFKLRGREYECQIGKCSLESAKTQAVILARQHVHKMFEGLLT